MPRIDESGEVYEEPRFLGKKSFIAVLAAFFIGLGFCYAFVPFYLRTSGEGYASLLLGWSELAYPAWVLGLATFVADLAFGGYLISLLFLKIEKLEKRFFLTLVVSSFFHLIVAVALGANDHLPAMITGLVYAALCLLFIYIDFRFFNDL